MTTFKLATVALALAAVASTSAFADAGNHPSQLAAPQTATYQATRTATSAASISAVDAYLLNRDTVSQN